MARVFGSGHLDVELHIYVTMIFLAHERTNIHV